MIRRVAVLAALAPALTLAAVGPEPAATLAPTNNLSFNAGADLRIREEIMDNIPGLPGGGVLSRARYSDLKNHVRFRPRVWAEVKAAEHWRFYTRLTDEFRWNIRNGSSSTVFPDELIVDNLFLAATDLWDGRFDFTVGRQDLFGYAGLERVFVDGTPGDGSRTVFSDMVTGAFKFPETGRLDVFFLHNADENVLRWGNERSKHRSLSGLGGNAEPTMDDWGWGGIWTGKLAAGGNYKLFAMQKVAESFWRDGVKHPWYRRELLGGSFNPKLTEEWSLELEAMGQVGRNGDGDWLSGWSTYTGVAWRDAGEGVKPFGKLGFHTMSGDEDAIEDDNGGNHAWDPMWARGVNDSELFLYGTHYGAAWWSNMMYLKAEAGVEFSKLHKVVATTGPIFAAAKDGLGGGDGAFKGLLSQIRYDFPILVADRSKGERFEIVAHLLAELFNPGDYFDTGRPAWFLRWQVDFRF